MYPIGQIAAGFAPRRRSVAEVWTLAGAVVLAEVRAKGGTAFGDATVDRGVARTGEAHDLVVAISETLQVEGFALRGLEGLQRLQSLKMLDVVERLRVG